VPKTIEHDGSKGKTKPFFIASLFGPSHVKKALAKTSAWVKKDPSKTSAKARSHTNYDKHQSRNRYKKSQSRTRYAKSLYNIRDAWRPGSILEVYSRSYNTWFTGKVEGLGYDEDGEFFEIHYTNDTTGKHMIKYLNRFDPHLRRIGGQTPVLRTPRIRRRPPSQNCEYPILNKRSDRSSNVPKRHSINKKPLGLQVGLLQQDVVDELLRGKIRGLFSSSSTDAKIEGFGDAKIPEYSDSEGMEDEMIDAFIEERNHLACSTNYHSSISSEMPHQMSVGADFDGVDFDEQAEEVRGGGRVASDDDESESEETLRLAWLDAEEFENFFKCSLSGFLRRFQYYE